MCLLLLSLVGTFTFAGITAYVVSKLSSGSAGVAQSGQREPAPLNPAAYARGQKVYSTSCVACHGANGTGVPRLGKDLVRSRMVLRQSDDALISFIESGRAATDAQNTTGIPMPPKGGNTSLTSADMADIVVYLRGLQHPLRVPAAELPTAVVQAPAPEPLPAASPQPEAASNAAALPSAAPPAVANASVSTDPEAIARGKKVYVSCVACHGKEGAGVKGMGKSLVQSAFVKSKTDDQLLDFIKKGRGPTDPENTTKMGMPPKGGNPALNDKQLRDLVAYLRSLESAAQKN
jgi:disulfide bond formation protein DsbB